MSRMIGSLMGFVDLHSHVLPALDDGVRGPARGLALIAIAGEHGVRDRLRTPHQKAGFFAPHARADRRRLREVRRRWPRAAASSSCYSAPRTSGTSCSSSALADRSQPTYTGGRAFLVELDVAHGAAAARGDAVSASRLGGPLPVLAHPERYRAFWDAPRSGWRRSGARRRWWSTWARSTARTARGSARRAHGWSTRGWRTRAPATSTPSPMRAARAPASPGSARSAGTSGGATDCSTRIRDGSCNGELPD